LHAELYDACTHHFAMLQSENTRVAAGVVNQLLKARRSARREKQAQRTRPQTSNPYRTIAPVIAFTFTLRSRPACTIFTS
jgi:hypothetical protein